MRRPRRLALVFVSLAMVQVAAAESGNREGIQEDPESLLEMSLEDLMEINLEAMGVTGIHHTHTAGEMMVGYSFMFMRMEGNRTRTTRLDTSDVLADFSVAPTDMSMQMHMLHLMYAPLDDLTLMLMVPYVRKRMDHVGPMGKFTTESHGLGDIKLTGLYALLEGAEHLLIFTSALDLPSGSISRKDDTPMGHVRLPYPMQIGSGSVELTPGLTYLGQKNDWAWGTRAAGTIRLHENSKGYRLGNSVKLTGWGSRKFTDWLSGSLRVEGHHWGNIKGSDPSLMPTLVPTADPDRRGGQRIDMLFGMNLFQQDGRLAGNRISIEGGIPVYQWLYGPQLETDWMLFVTWDWTF